jgi:transcriptional regulator
MYRPEYTKTNDDAKIADLVKSYPFVTLISNGKSGEPFVSHVPVVTEFSNNKIVSIQGHIAVRNPHTEIFKQNPLVTVIFHGPHTYITPTWYTSGRDVPTWNYCVVHVKGNLKLNSSFHAICKNLADLTKEFEGKNENPWKFELPPDLKDPAHLTAAIVAFEITPVQIEAKFKLAQSRPRTDQESVIAGLAKRTDDMSREIAALMKQNLEKI